MEDGVGRLSWRQIGRLRAGAWVRAGTRLRWLVLAIPLLVFLGVFYFWPMLEIAHRSVAEPPPTGLGNYREFLGAEGYVRVLQQTFRTAAVVTGVCAVVGYVYAYFVHVAPPRLRPFLLFAVLLPFWSSLLVRSYAWTVILRDSGVVNSVLERFGVIEKPLEIIRTETAVVIGMTHVLLPFMVVPTYLAMRQIDPDFDHAARNLGAGAIASFRRVFFPMSLGGALAGTMLVFVLALGYYITPALLGGPSSQMLGQLIVEQVSRQLNWGLGGAMAMVLTMLTLGAVAVTTRLVRVQDVFSTGPVD